LQLVPQRSGTPILNIIVNSKKERALFAQEREMMKMAGKVDKYITNDMALDFQAGVPIRTIPSVESRARATLAASERAVQPLGCFLPDARTRPRCDAKRSDLSFLSL